MRGSEVLQHGSTGASRLQPLRPMRRVAEPGSLGRCTRHGATQQDTEEGKASDCECSHAVAFHCCDSVCCRRLAPPGWRTLLARRCSWLADRVHHRLWRIMVTCTCQIIRPNHALQRTRRDGAVGNLQSHDSHHSVNAREISNRSRDCGRRKTADPEMLSKDSAPLSLQQNWRMATQCVGAVLPCHPLRMFQH